MNKNLYIGNLANQVTEEDLRTNFSEAGQVRSEERRVGKEC
jgi:RNA recognition motif-containing protein